MPSELEAFGLDLRQDVIAEANLEGAEAPIIAILTKRFIQDLTDVAELDDGEVAYSRQRGWEVNGYSISDDDTRLDLFLTISALHPAATVVRGELESGFKKLTTFLQKARGRLYEDLEESTAEWDMANAIHRLADLRRVRLYIFTDGRTTPLERPATEVDGVSITYHVWDLPRLYRALTSGQQQEPIEIDFIEQFGSAPPCLVAPSDSTDYTAHLAIIPGEMLSSIYEEYGNRLLERNVRAFLQTRGKVNRGIQETIVKEPGRFLAYNNGISATASEIETMPLPGGGLGIRRVKDFQVVNGGQTTASIHHAKVKAKIDISDIHVQAKLTRVDPEHLTAIVPLISRYANSQNKVNEADFEANDPFHVAVEKQSRSVWTPAADGTQQQTRWFYERARGQYQDELGKELTPARKRQFKVVHPTSQKFTKTDLAKYENTWDQFPHIVSLGSEKNFRHYTTRLQQRGKVQMTSFAFEEIVAKAILFRRAEKAVSQMNYGAYRANIVTYTLAHISHASDQQIDLTAIWRQQNISEATWNAIQEISAPVREVILDAPGSGNITEWCKKAACWDTVRNLRLTLPAALRREFRPVAQDRYRIAERLVEELRRAGGWEGRSDLLHLSGVPEAEWTPTIKLLMEQGRIERRGEKRGAEYRITPE
jgi:hypothetical protein